MKECEEGGYFHLFCRRSGAERTKVLHKPPPNAHNQTQMFPGRHIVSYADGIVAFPLTGFAPIMTSTPHWQTRRMLMRKALSVAALGAAGSLAWAQKYPVTAEQRQIARASAGRGVPISELAPGAPSEYVVKRGDTLWDISGKFLKRPWRWPELWGMNLQQIKNPHLIYPGQVLWLEIVNGRARLRSGRLISGGRGSGQLSPRVRAESLGDTAIPTVSARLIEPFLAEPLIVDENTLKNAPRIVASRERELLSKGDRAYARGPDNTPLRDQGSDEANAYRIFRNVVPIRDPGTQEILGYEAQYVGRAQLVRNETVSTSADGGKAGVPEAAAIDIVASKEEIRAGDRLLPEPPRELLTHTPHAPLVEIGGLVASVYGNAVANVGQNQVITINKGIKDGIVRGDVLALISTGRRMLDTTEERRDDIKLPDERNGLLYIFRPFERVSYGLVMQVRDPVKVGDRVENPIAPAEPEEVPPPPGQ